MNTLFAWIGSIFIILINQEVVNTCSANCNPIAAVRCLRHEDCPSSSECCQAKAGSFACCAFHRHGYTTATELVTLTTEAVGCRADCSESDESCRFDHECDFPKLCCLNKTDPSRKCCSSNPVN